MIEVGEYIRTDNGLIGKYYINKNSFNVIVSNEKEIGIDIEKDIVKHSKNIIDLIEVGDIVHTRDVLNEDIVYIWSEEYLKALKEDLNNGIELVEILTHEQYMKNCYTVERKE